MTTEELTILIQSLQEQIKQGQEIENEVWFLIDFIKMIWYLRYKIASTWYR